MHQHSVVGVISGYPLFFMNTRKFVLLALLCFATVSFAQKTPKVTLSAVTVLHSGHVDMKGTGFTPRHDVFSHLRRPDGTEFPVLPMLTDDRGEFTHDIDTLLLSPGPHEVWVVDDGSKTTSNIARFEVVLERPPSTR